MSLSLGSSRGGSRRKRERGFRTQSLHQQLYYPVALPQRRSQGWITCTCSAHILHPPRESCFRERRRRTFLLARRPARAAALALALRLPSRTLSSTASPREKERQNSLSSLQPSRRPGPSDARALSTRRPVPAAASRAPSCATGSRRTGTCRTSNGRRVSSTRRERPSRRER